MKLVVLGLRGIPKVPGGIETHCDALYPRIAKSGCSITLIGRCGYIPSKPYTYSGIRIKPLWAFRRKALESFLHTLLGISWIILHRKKFDIVHLHAIGPSLFAPIARFMGFKVVVTHHGADYRREKWGTIASMVLRIGEYLGSKFAHRTIAVSKGIKKELLRRLEVDSVYIPNGVEPAKNISPGITLKHHDLDSKKYILAVGRLDPAKGFHVLMDTFLSITTDWKLVIVGDADHEDVYSRSLKQKASGSNRIVMTGYLKGDSLKELYTNAGLFVLPSFHEGLPIVVLEAMSFGIPMLVSDISANREVASEAEIFPVGDPGALRLVLADFLDNPSDYFRPDLFENRQKRLDNEFNWDVIAEKTFQLYRNLCTGRINA